MSTTTTTGWQSNNPTKSKIKRLTKDQREIINQRNSIPFIQNISFTKFGSDIRQYNVCGGRYSLLELTIPNYKDLVVRICSICMKYLNRIIQTFNTGQENSNKINRLTNKRDFDEIN